MSKTMLRLGGLIVAATVALILPAFNAASAQGTDPSNGSALCPIDRDAYTIRAEKPEMPDIARQQYASGTVELKVSIAPNGQVTNVSVLKSSGNRFLDIAAIQAARTSEFAPDVRSCHPTGGSYMFVVEFPG